MMQRNSDRKQKTKERITRVCIIENTRAFRRDKRNRPLYGGVR